MVRRLSLAIALLLVGGGGTPAHGAREDPAALVAQAQQRLDQEDAASALPLAEQAVKKGPRYAPAYLVRATARLMLGEPGGKEDLDKAIALDPALRQAWLNRAGVALSEKRYDAALADLQKARDLDPADPGAALNLGAVQLLMGKLDAASKSFESYLGQRPRDAQAHYLVARNYALAGYAGLAIESLQQAIALDERSRAAARVDANFGDLASNPRFQQILATDGYQPPPDAYHGRRTYPGGYDGGRGPLLPATLDALNFVKEPYEPQAEVTPDWALLWGAVRIKLSDAAPGQGVVELTAVPGAMTATEWQQRSTRLLDSIFIQLAKRQATPTGKPPGGAG